MIFGKVGQLLIQKIYPEDEAEYENNKLVFSHTDVLEDKKYPIEVKFSSMKIFRASDVPEYWVKQLMRYMSVHDSDIGWLVIINLFTRQLTAFKMMMTREEREQQISEMVRFVSLIGSWRKGGKFPDDYVVPLTEEQVSECKRCDHKPSPTRKKKGLDDGCSKYITEKSLTL